ncbi:hypothetical protein B0H13DRAFT_1919295 [Mycena leptocephala]|nr:hypothetical protein B0H13DRAFT_1919295 [Mycena leptocephala]
MNANFAPLLAPAGPAPVVHPILAAHYNLGARNGPKTGPLPHRATCKPPFYPEYPTLDRDLCSLTTGKKFYVACPAFVEGIYTDSDCARSTTEGCKDGVALGAPTWDDALGMWALQCLRWHGDQECHREFLQRPDGSGIIWALKGHRDAIGSRAAAFRLAEEKGLMDIHIRGSRDLALILEFIEDGDEAPESQAAMGYEHVHASVGHLPLTELLDKPHRRPTPGETLCLLHQHAGARQKVLPCVRAPGPQRRHQVEPARLIAELEREKEKLLEEMSYFRVIAEMALECLQSAGVFCGKDWF